MASWGLFFSRTRSVIVVAGFEIKIDSQLMSKYSLFLWVMSNYCLGPCLFCSELQTTLQIHMMEEKRRNYLKLKESRERKPSFKSVEQVNRERLDGKWSTAKIREELCLIHEAYQFFRIKYRKRYGDCIPHPSMFLKDNK